MSKLCFLTQFKKMVRFKRALSTKNNIGEIMNNSSYCTKERKIKKQVVDIETGEVLSSILINKTLNQDFVMFNRKHLSQIRTLQALDNRASILFMFFVEYMDTANSLIVSAETIADKLKWSKTTIYRKISFLRDNGFIETRRTGGSLIYFINASVVWSTHSDKKQYAEFNSRVLISMDEQEPKAKFKSRKEIL